MMDEKTVKMTENNQKLKILRQALYYRNMNFSIIPVLPKSKKPLISWKRYQERPATPEEIEKWFTEHPDANIGLVTGRVSGVVVVDVDDKDAVPDWLKDIQTWIVKTGRGYHFYFKVNGEFIPTAKITEKIDLKGEGSYVLLPESVHPSGVKYRWMRFRSIPEPASFDLVREKILPFLRKDPEEERRDLSELYRGVEEGRRNISMTRIAGSLFADGLSEEEVYELLKAVNERNTPPLPEREIRSIVKSIAKRRKSFLREKERIVSILMRIFVNEFKKEDSEFIRAIKKISYEIERIKEGLPEKDRHFVEAELGRLVFPKLIKIIKAHFIAHPEKKRRPTPDEMNQERMKNEEVYNS